MRLLKNMVAPLVMLCQLLIVSGSAAQGNHSGKDTSLKGVSKCKLTDKDSIVHTKNHVLWNGDQSIKRVTKDHKEIGKKIVLAGKNADDTNQIPHEHLSWNGDKTIVRRVKQAGDTVKPADKIQYHKKDTLQHVKNHTMW